MDDLAILRQAERYAEQEVPRVSRDLTTTSSQTVAQKVIAFYRRMDHLMGRSPEAIDCKEGCGYCCYYHVLVTPAEAIALADFISNLPAERQRTLRTRLSETAARTATLTEDEYIRTNVPCAFLESGRCGVYGARPTPCRGFHSRDVAICKRAFDDPFSTEPNKFDPAREAVKIGYRNAVLAAQVNAGFDGTSYEMHGAVNEALTNRAAVKRWKQGKIAFPAVSDRRSIDDMLP
ncbi:YkgJ family cysteine cluster protein [Paraburkholderia strydomiana]